MMNTKKLSSTALIGASLLAVMLAGCSSGTESRIEMTIVESYEDASPMGCIGTNWNTILRAQDGRTDRICGKLGRPGDKVSGCWISGASDPIRNGFRNVC